MKSCGVAMLNLHGKSPDLHDAVAKELRVHGRVQDIGTCCRKLRQGG